MNLKTFTENRAISLLRQTVTEWLEDGALRLSAALAYYSMFSIAPLLIIVISIAGLFFGDEAVRGQLDEQLRSYVGEQAAAGIQGMVQGAAKPTQGWISAVIGFVALIFGASGVFGQLKDALNTIWEVKMTDSGGVKRFVWQHLLSFGMVLVIGFLLLTSLMLTAAIAALNTFLNSFLGIPAEVWAFVTMIVSMALVMVLFAIMFKVLPDAKIQWRHVWVGAAATAILFEIGKFALGFYLGRESTASSYGAAGSVILVLLWVYYASCILLFGAEFTQVYANSSGRFVEAAYNAVPVTVEARAQQGLPPSTSPQPASASAVIPDIKIIQVKAPEPGAALSPAALFLSTTAAAFLTGLAYRRWGR